MTALQSSASAVEPGHEVDELHRIYADQGGRGALDRLVIHYRGYAVSLARRLDRGNEPLDDLVQVAMEGLLLALRRYDPDRGIPFRAFATPTIVGVLKRYFRDAGWAIRVGRKVHDLYPAARREADRLAQELGRPAKVGEVAGNLGVTEESLLEALAAVDSRQTASLDAPAVPGREATLTSVVGSDDPGFARVEHASDLARSLRCLSDQERQVLDLYYGGELSQAEIGARLGVSQVQISRVLNRSVRRLRSRMSG